MARNELFDDSVSRWLEDTAPARIPERVLQATFERTRGSGQHVGWRALLGRLSMPRFLPALGSAAAIVVVAVVALSFYVNQPGIGGPATPSPTASQSPAAQQPSHSPSIKPTISGSMWPQSTLEEVQAAQELVDAGDLDYTWQVDPDLGARLSQGGPYRSEIFNRFLEEELGWEEFRWTGHVVFIRCASGGANPIYPDEPAGDRCAPTIDEFRYETVQINVAQPVRQDATGIWVVTGWEMIEPFEQIAPPSEAEVTELLNGFLQARIDGEGADEYVWVLVDGPEIPFLYATPAGAPYERYEFEVANGPMWPNGQMRLRVRLFAEDGDTVVEQFMLLERLERGLWYESSSYWDYEPQPGTTVNGQAVPVPHSLLDGEVTLRLTHPWHGANWEIGSGFSMQSMQPDEFQGTILPLGSGTLRTGCQEGPAPADAQSLAREIRSNPDLEATAPVTMSIGGMPALQLDVTTAPGAPSDCEPSDGPGVATSLVVMEVPVYPEIRVRLYLVDLPQGSSARTLAIAFGAHEATFEHAVDSAPPILQSIEFHAP